MLFKCLEKEPRRRYQTAHELSEDLTRFLNGDAISARPAGVATRLWRWCKRRPAQATILVAVSAILLLLVVFLGHEQQRRWERRETAIVSISKEALTTHGDGWSERAWNDVKDAAAVRADPELRDAAFATLSGVDATLYRRFGLAATQVVFDINGKRSLLGPYENYENSAARVWDNTRNAWQVSTRCEPGPVVFAADGSAWQIMAVTPTRYVIWDIDKNQAVRALDLPPADKTLPEPDQLGLSMAASPRGELFAASGTRPDGSGAVTVWNTRDGKILRTFPARVNTLGFSPDAKWLAAGDEGGHVMVWSIATGEEKATLQSDELPLCSLAFGRNHRVPVVDKLEHWLLAAGDAGGTVTVWDLDRKLPRSYCRGSARHIYDVEFSPDGATLASCGRLLVKLWDVASSRLLLSIEAGNTQFGLAFSANGRQLAFTSAPVHGSPARVDILNLDNGRGVATFRGLQASICRATFSRDGRQLAAISGDWKVGIWDLATGQLKMVLKVSMGFFEDNADLDFSVNGRQIAFASGRLATLWDLTTGQLVRPWYLPPGLQDEVRFCPDGKLLLIRFETKDGLLPPASVAPPDQHPRVCRVRNLLAPDPTRPLGDEVTGFNWHVFRITATGDGSVFAVTGVHRGPDGERQSVRVFDSLTGHELWGIAVPKDNIWPSSDPMGELLMVNGVDGWGDLVEFRTGKLLRRAPMRGHLSPQARYIGHTPGLWSGDTGEELVRFDGKLSACKHSSFSPDGKYFAWGTLDGSVFVCDIQDALRRLSTVGLINN